MPPPKHLRPVALRTVRTLLRARYGFMREQGDHSTPIRLTIEREELGDTLVIVAPRIGALPYNWDYDGVRLFYCRPLV